MAIKVAINGFGRIGRSIAKILFEQQLHKDIILVAINDLNDITTAAHLLKYDSVYGKLDLEVATNNDSIYIANHRVRFFSENDVKKLPWNQLKIDVVLECTGVMNSYDASYNHIVAGAKKVLISAPAKSVDNTIVYGVNHDKLQPGCKVVSNASCTTNCVATVLSHIDEVFGVESCIVSTVHSYTKDQNLVDAGHKDLRRARSATQSIIPTKTGVTSVISEVLPALKGKVEGLSIRVPTISVSLADLNLVVKKPLSISSLNNSLQQSKNGRLKSIMDVSSIPLVSIDFKKNPASAVVDLTQTKVTGNLVKILAWYDNEWAFASRMLDTAVVMGNL